MSFLSDIGGGLIKSITGTDPAQLQAEVTAAEQQLSIAFQTLIALSAVTVAELFLVVVLLWKARRD